MKKLLVLTVFLFASTLFSQSLVLEISYYKTENDGNRSTRLEKFSIIGSTSAYSIEYTGQTMPNEGNELKNCELSPLKVDEILTSIKENKAAVNETFYGKESIIGKGMIYLVINVKMVYDGTPYDILLDGDAGLVMGNKVYPRVIELIKDLRRIIKDC
ncbi:MAG: hypothetical protein IAE93_04055 [Ignavibacteria bacterium]|nr:hypothetical protein [Ignavibacteria bacterium]